jgi:hypothetical protein
MRAYAFQRIDIALATSPKTFFNSLLEMEPDHFYLAALTHLTDAAHSISNWPDGFFEPA